MEVAFTLNLPREAASVPVVRRLCRAAFRGLGVADDCLADLELAVTEACTNVLKHASGTDDCYDVEIWTDGATCDLRVRDTGTGFDPQSGAVVAPQQAAESGRGIHLMRVLVDRLRFASGDDAGTVVHLEKSLELREDSPLAAVLAGTNGAGARRPYTG
jgi:serine/threonine-protein kinase RsbW